MRNLPTFVPPLDYARRFTGTDDVLGHYKLGGTRHCDGLALTIFIQGNYRTVTSDSSRCLEGAQVPICITGKVPPRLGAGPRLRPDL